MKKISFLVLVLAFGFWIDVAAYEEISVSDGGSVTGRVIFKGRVPPPIVLPINKNPEVCGAEKRIIQDVIVKGEGLANTVVYLADIEKGRAFVPPGYGFKVAQEKCRFIPHMQVIKQKANLTIINNDSTAHNIHTFEIGERFARTLFNQMQPNSAVKITERVRLRRSNVMKVECDIHSFMHAWIFVLNHPYFSITSAEGGFKISGIPAGKYTIRAWNPTLGEIEKSVTVKDNDIGKIILEFNGE